MASFWSKMRAGLQAFREGFMSADTLDEREFGEFEARRLRYDLLWAIYENTAYRDIHSWSKKLRGDYGLYKYIRGIHNPAFRLIEFHVTHLLGGPLDLEAGDGTKTPTAIPITGASSTLKKAIAATWRNSNWAIQKEVWTRRGTCFGDAGLLVVDDVAREKVYLKPLHPGTLKDAVLDPWGNVKGYTIEEERPDPRPGRRPEAPYVTYTEVCMRDGDNVVYRTFLNNAPYNWTDDPSAKPEWTEPYGFVPLVLNQHLNVGLDWGWSELHAGLGKFREVDDQASALSDQIRKLVNAPWLFTGMTENDRPKRPTRSAGEAGKQEAVILYGDKDARAHALVAPVPIGEVSERINGQIAEIERDYPELQMDIWTASGSASGRALRVARQRVTGKMLMRRTGYDSALVRAHQMCVAIGGHRGYEGYRGFSLDSYASGKLDHQIGARSVFEVDPLDEIEQDKEFWTAAKSAEDAGMPIELYLERKGWSEADIAKIKAAKAARQQEAAARAQQTQPGQVATTNDQRPTDNQPIEE